MKTTLENLSPIKKKLTVDLPVEKVAAAIEKAYVEVQKKAKMKGFREGKVPRNLIELHFKSNVEDAAIEELVQTSIVDAIKAEAQNPVSRPEITVGEFNAFGPFSYSATFEINPVVEAKGYTSLTLEKTERNITDDLVDRRLEAIRKSMTQLAPAADDQGVEKGFIAFIDFNGTADGKEFKGSKADNFILDVGEGNLLPVFEEKIFGLKKGEQRHVEFDYPKDYFNTEVAGKHGVFDVTVKDIKKKVLPELNDDFAKDMGPYKTLDEVKADIRKRMEDAVAFEAKTELANHAMELIVDKHEFEVPEVLVMEELKLMFQQFVRQLSASGRKFEDTGIKPEQFIEQYKPVAEKRVKGYFILDAIAKAENIAATDEDVEAKIKLFAENSRQPIEKVREFYGTEENKNLLKTDILHEKVLDFVVSKAKVKAKKAKK